MQIQSGIRKILEIPMVYKLFQNLVGKKSTKIWFVNQIWKIGKGQKVVDMGCGPGTLLNLLSQNLTQNFEYIGFDISEEYIKIAQKNHKRGTFILGTAHDLLSNSNNRLDNADIVICNGLLHHLDDIEVMKILELSSKILKPGGRLVCLEPTFLISQGKISKWIMSKDRGQNIRKEQGYKNLISKYFDTFTTNIATGLKRIPYTHIIIECRK